MKNNKTFSQNPNQVERNWHLIDATGLALGRVTTTVVELLMGKRKPVYTPHVDGGDYVIIVNSDKIKLTGNKEDQKMYYRHSGYIGNLKSRTAKQQRELDSRVLIQKAVSGMLPKNKLRKLRLKRLKIYRQSEHNHQAQQATLVSMESKKS